MKKIIFVIGLCCAVHVHAAFTLGGQTITQTGTDNTASFIAGISAIAGVTVTTYGGTTHSTFYVVDYGNLSLRVEGTLDVDMNRQTWIFHGTDTTNRLVVPNGGHLHLISNQTRNGFAYNPEQGQIWFAFDNDTANWNNRSIDTQVGCDVVFNGITIKGEHSPWIQGNTTFKNCIIEKVGNNGDIQFNISNGDDTVLEDVKMYVDGQSGITFRSGVPTISNVQIFGARDSFNNESAETIIVEGLDSETGATADVSQFTQNGGPRVVVLNAKLGSQFIWADHLNGGNPLDFRDGRVEVAQSLTVSVKDSDSNGIQNAKLYIPDNPSLSIADATTHTCIWFDNQSAQTDRTYIRFTDVNGDIATFNILIAEGKSGSGDVQNGRIRGRGKNPVAYFFGQSIPDDLFDWGAISYLHSLSTGEIAFRSVEGSFINSVMADDFLITEPNKAVVDGYATIDNSDQFYDSAKAFLYDNYVGESETIVLRADETIDARNYNVVVDASAAQTFDFDGTTITIRSNFFQGDFIATTGTVTSANGAVIDGGIIDVSFDSFIRFENVTTWTVFANETDALSNSTSIGSGVGGEVFNFNFSSGITYYFRITNDNGYVFVYKVTPPQAGKTFVTFSEILNVISKSVNDLNVLLENQDVINKNIQLASCIIPADVLTNTTAISTSNGTLAVGNPASGTASLSFVGIVDWYIYNSESDAISGSNQIATGLQADGFNFDYTAEMLFFVAVYTTDGARIIRKYIPTGTGNSTLNFSSQQIIDDLNASIVKLRNNQNIMNTNEINSSILVPAMDEVDK